MEACISCKCRSSFIHAGRSTSGSQNVCALQPHDNYTQKRTTGPPTLSDFWDCLASSRLCMLFLNLSCSTPACGGPAHHAAGGNPSFICTSRCPTVEARIRTCCGKDCRKPSDVYWVGAPFKFRPNLLPGLGQGDLHMLGQFFRLESGFWAGWLSVGTCVVLQSRQGEVQPFEIM